MIYVSSSPKSHNISKCSTSRCSRTSPSLSLACFLPPVHLRCHKDTSAETSSFGSAGELCLLGTYLITLRCLMTRNTHTHPLPDCKVRTSVNVEGNGRDGGETDKKQCSCSLSILNFLLIHYYKARHNYFLCICGRCAWGHAMRPQMFSLLLCVIFK